MYIWRPKRERISPYGLGVYFSIYKMRNYLREVSCC